MATPVPEVGGKDDKGKGKAADKKGKKVSFCRKREGEGEGRGGRGKGGERFLVCIHTYDGYRCVCYQVELDGVHSVYRCR